MRADVIIPRGAENQTAVDVLVQHILDILLHRTPEYKPIETAIESDILVERTRTRSEPFNAVLS